ncbi:MAG: heme-binding beta-barrel domain-containing protein [Nitrospira sp.]|nr:heme-binding beta-barrel domain-containing protein [Nitrospira sp.]
MFEPIGAVCNHEQVLYGLRYATVARRLGKIDPFHEEGGYWLRDSGEQQVLRCFIIPRGVALIAGGTVTPTATSFTLVAEAGSDTCGICSNRFLDKEFKTVRYELTVTMLDANRFHYKEDSQLRMPGRPDLFHHTDGNTLTRVTA